ncbi:Hypothetical predicted protein [Cloeon dipterum]|uniref:Caspase family p20 domain-containing protein n=1 Tax=Cloeon dipterum TaxID=197152 RepID=A0A8S1C6R8_9INSE|nr:Hypothetical predicted protein [Cloeon dipterum]
MTSSLQHLGKTEGSPNGPALLGYFEETQKDAENVCVLVIDYKFEKDINHIRYGCEKDRENLRETFYVRRNCRFCQLLSPRKEDLLQLISNEDNLLQLFDSQTPPSVFILFILSHGKRNGIIATDHKNESGKYVSFSTTEILDSLKELNSFKDSLKLIFFAPCRGDEGNPLLLSSKCSSKNSCSVNALPNEPNFVLCYSTVETTLAERNTKFGTVFVQKICEVLNTTEKDVPLTVYLTLVQNKIHSSANQKGQTPEIKYFPHKGFMIMRLKTPTPTINEYEGVCGPRPTHQATRSNFFPWLSSSGERNVRGKKAILIYDYFDKSVQMLEKILRENVSFETSFANNSNADLRNLYEKVQGEQSDVGCVAVFYFARICVGVDGEICVSVEGGIVPICDIIYRFVGPSNEKWIGRPKLFFFQNQTTSSDAYHEKAMVSLYNIISTNHSGLFVQIQPNGDDASHQLVRMFDNPEIRNGKKSLQEAAAETMNSSSGQMVNVSLQPQIMSTLQHLLDFPVWPLRFIKPRFASDYYGLNFDELLLECEKDYFQSHDQNEYEYRVRLLVSGAGFGKTVIMREMSEHFKRIQREKFVIRWLLLSEYDFIDDCPSLGVREFLTRASRDFLRLDVQRAMELKNVIIFLDGFDELCERLRPKILKLIREISELRLPLWVASRPQEKELQLLLEDVSTELYTIYPFDDSEQTKLLKIITNKSEKECKRIQSRFTAMENNNILENPLHLTMIAETPDIAENAYSLYHFYEKVLDHRVREALKNRECYDESNRRFNSILKERMSLLQDTAAYYLFRTSSDVKLQLSKSEIEKVNNTGIASIDPSYQGNQTDITFLHRTFAEFLTARKFLSEIVQSGSSLYEIFFEPRHQWCRFYVDVYLSDIKNRSRDLCTKLSDYLLETEWRLDRVFWERLTNVFEILEHEKLIETATDLSTMSLASSAWPEVAMKLIDMGVLQKTIEESEKREQKTAVMKLLMGAAVERGHDDLFQRYLDEWPNVDEYLNTKEETYTPEGYSEIMDSPLLVAACKRQVNIMQILIDRGADVQQCFVDLIGKDDKQSDNDQVVGDDFLEPIKLLVKAGSVNVNTEIGSEKTTALHWAVKNNHLQTARYLLENGAEVDALDVKGRSPLHESAQSSELEMCHLLVGWDANLDALTSAGDNVLHVAAGGAQEINLFYFLDMNRFDLTVKNGLGQNVLHLAAQKTCLFTFEKILNKSRELLLDTCASGRNILHYACLGRNLNVIQHILSLNSFDVNARDKFGRTPLLLAAASSQVEYYCKHHDTDVGDFSIAKLANLLLQQGADVLAVDAELNNAMHLSCFSADTSSVKYLMRTGCFDLNAKNLAGETPLLAATTSERNLTIVEELVENGADILAANNQGCNALHYASKFSKPAFAKMLFELGPFDVNARNAAGETPILIAAKHSSMWTIWYLTDDMNADLTAVDYANRNVLHLAAEFNSIEEVQYFINYDVSLVSSKTAAGEYPHQLALRNPRKLVQKLFTSNLESLKEVFEESCAVVFLGEMSKLRQ